MTDNIREFIRYKINACEDRENMVVALANAGYKVWVVRETHLIETDFFVCVEKIWQIR